MKIRLAFLALTLPVAALAQNRPTASSEQTLPPPANTTINLRSTAAELADGYAAAFTQMTLKSLVIYLKSEIKVTPIKGVRSVRAMGAVLLIEFSAGDRMAVNAQD